MLPEELLHRIVEHLVYEPNIEEREQPKFQFHQATEGLCSLSLVDRRLRRNCFPFLFEYVTTPKGYRGYQRFIDQCRNSIEFASSIRSLRISYLSEARLDLDDQFNFTIDKHSLLLRQTLSILPHLLWIDLSLLKLDRDSMKALHNHQTIATIMIESLDDLPKDINCLDLSKVVARNSDTYEGSLFEQYLSRGGQVRNLLVDTPRPPLLNKLSSLQFQGIRKLELIMSNPDISWLLEFACCHPSLQKMTIWFGEEEADSIPFIKSFYEDLDGTELQEVAIQTVALERPAELVSTTDAFVEWRVSEVNLVRKTHDSSDWVHALRRAHASFPDLSTLHLGNEASEKNVDLVDLSSALRPFTLLRILHLEGCTFGDLDFEYHKSSWELIFECVEVRYRFEKPLKSIKALAGVVWFAYQIAREIPSIDVVHIHEPYGKRPRVAGRLRMQRPLNAVADIDWEGLTIWL